MKYTCTWLVVTLYLAAGAAAQSVNQITIVPSNPSPGDTIRIISGFSYQGNCSFGMVGAYSDVVNDTIRIFPTYCGYGDTTLCHRTDTFTIDPLPAGNYTVFIEYHQGSICPFSGFDITLLQTDTVIAVNATHIPTTAATQHSIQAWPNPSGEYIMIDGNELNSSHSIYITNASGQIVFRRQVTQKPMLISTSGWEEKGIYIIHIQDTEGKLTGIQKIMLQ